MRTIFIGDVHGCWDELKALLDKLQATSSDRIVYLGDLVDRGPHPREVIDTVRATGVSILGNHERSTLKRRSKDPAELVPHHLFTMNELSGRDFDYFAYMDALPLYLEYHDLGAVAVHAGLVPDVPVERQREYLLLQAQRVRPPEARGRTDWQPTAETFGFGDEHPEAKFWTTFYNTRAEELRKEENLGRRSTLPPRVYFGHTVLSAPYITPWTIGLDTGCCFGGALSAYIHETATLVQVPARKVYFPPRTRKAPLAPGVDALY